MAGCGRDLLASALAGTDPEEQPLRHVAELPANHGTTAAWPRWAARDVIDAFAGRGVTAPWAHQGGARPVAHEGRHVVISTGTASGKSLASQLPILCALATNRR